MTEGSRRRGIAVRGVAALAISAGLAAAAQPTAHAAPGVAWAPTAQWTQAYIHEADGTVLHADVLRPKGLRATDRTPVILSVGPYFNHSGSGGVIGAVDGLPYNPSIPVQPNDRFADLINDGHLLERGYTFVAVDLRGFGGSTGCLDYLGPGEQADVSAAVTWAARQPWSTGKVGMYGKSYDATTGLAGVASAPAGLAAVVAQEPIYDAYRYLYQNGVQYANSLIEGPWYGQIASTPGVVGGDDRTYLSHSAYEMSHPHCVVDNASAQITDSNHQSAYWRARDLIGRVHDSPVPLFLTQGLIEDNTLPDGLTATIAGRSAPTRAWLGMWDHVRGNDTVEDGRRLAMGRKGWFAEVMRFFDKYVKGENVRADPAMVVEDNTGSWRQQQRWPLVGQRQSILLPTGTFVDSGIAIGSLGTQVGTVRALDAADHGTGLWKLSNPVGAPVRISGSPTITVTTNAAARSNLVVDLYDVSRTTTVRITRSATTIPSGNDRRTQFDLLPTDWVLQPGHRLAVRVVNANSEIYLHQSSGQSVRVLRGVLEVPTTKVAGTATDGVGSVYLEKYLAGAGRYHSPIPVTVGSFNLSS